MKKWLPLLLLYCALSIGTAYADSFYLAESGGAGEPLTSLGNCLEYEYTGMPIVPIDYNLRSLTTTSGQTLGFSVSYTYYDEVLTLTDLAQLELSPERLSALAPYELGTYTCTLKSDTCSLSKTYSIVKAHPLGEPVCDRVLTNTVTRLRDRTPTNWLKTAADQPVYGMWEWVESDTTIIVPNTAYTLRFVPRNTDHYYPVERTVCFTDEVLAPVDEPGPGWYTITTNNDMNGIIWAPGTRLFQAGTVVEFTIKADYPYTLLDVAAFRTQGFRIPVTSLGNGRYSIVMPDSDVIIDPRFDDGQDHSDVTAEGFLGITDVPEDAWYQDDVKYMMEHKWAIEQSPGVFAPNAPITRGDLLAIMWRHESSISYDGAQTYTDVVPGSLNYVAIEWATQAQIATGYGNKIFGPLDNLTREQMVAILWRYAGNPMPEGNRPEYADWYKVGDWAKVSMGWALIKGYVKGTSSSTIDPQGTVTRAQVCAILHRFYNDLEGEG